AAQGLVARARDGADALDQRLRVGEPADPEPVGDALRALRRRADRGDDRPPAGPLRHGEGGDRLMAERMLELKGVSKAFGGLQVISDLDFHVDTNEIVSVIGPNGAGKTTLFNLVTGVYTPDAGEILFE